MIRAQITYAFVLSITLAVLSCVALLIGSLQPPSTWAALLRLNDCELPCWIGIEPGETTLAQARRQVEIAYASASLYGLREQTSSFNVTYKSTGQALSIVLDSGNDGQTEQSILEKIHLWPDIALNSAAMLGELYDSLGESEAVRVSSVGGTPVLIASQRNQRVGVVLNSSDCNRVLPSQQIYVIVISAQSLGDYFSWLSPLMPWRGFERCYRF